LTDAGAVVRGPPGEVAMERSNVVVVGAGLAGLACARRLHQAGVGFTLVEAGDDVGGRVRTDVVEGFRLDRGFQVLLTAYPEARRVLDYAALDLRPFRAGALVRRGGRMQRLSDPRRRPQDVFAALRADVGGLRDKLRVLGLTRDVSAGPLDELFARPELSTEKRLRAAGFSAGFIDGFFRPWFGGVLLDRELRASSRMFDFVFRMLAEARRRCPRRAWARSRASSPSACPPAPCARARAPWPWRRTG
jgi:phytoene dehydrogenase-like protein